MINKLKKLILIRPLTLVIQLKKLTIAQKLLKLKRKYLIMIMLNILLQNNLIS